MGRVWIPAVALRLAVVAGLVVFAIYLGLWFSLILSDGSKAADYTAFMTGWTIVLGGRGDHLYDIATQMEVQRRLLGGLTFEAGLNPFNNPPHLVLPFVPLALLPLLPSYLVWGVIQLGLVTWLGWRLLTQVAIDWGRSERTLLIVALLAMPPLVITFFQGALSLLVSVATLEAFIALRAGRDRAASVWLVVVSLKPQVAVALGAAVLGARRRRVVAWGLGIVAATAALATLVMGVGIWSAYARFLGDYVGSFDVLSVRPSVMWNVRGTIAMLVGPERVATQADAINSVALVVWVVGLAVLALWWSRRRWDPTSKPYQLGFALTVLVGMLISPHLNPHDGLLLVPAGALAYGVIRELPSGPALGALLFAAPFLILLTNPISANSVEGTPIRVPVVIMLVMVVWILIALRRVSRAQERRTSAA
jgi:alpha-1,2-mannosyltransferase